MIEWYAAFAGKSTTHTFLLGLLIILVAGLSFPILFNKSAPKKNRAFTVLTLIIVVFFVGAIVTASVVRPDGSEFAVAGAFGGLIGALLSKIAEWIMDRMSPPKQ